MSISSEFFVFLPLMMLHSALDVLEEKLGKRNILQHFGQPSDFRQVTRLKSRYLVLLLFNNRYDAGVEYAREKVSHALRSRPSDDSKKRANKPKKKGTRKSQHAPELDETVERLIKEQQNLLRSMIDKKVFPVWMQDVKEKLST
jgi:hypothetical protein